MALARGYDVSDYQSSIPDDADFVIVKATEGRRTAQHTYHAKVAAARRRGLALGHYHFMHSENPVGDEVDFFCGTVGDLPAGEFLVLDFEPYNQGRSDAACTAWKDTWLAAVKGRYPGRLVGMYTNLDWWHRTNDTFGDFLWIADYQRAAGNPAVQAPWKFHQYAESPLDVDVYNGSADDLRAWLGAGSAPSAPPPPPPPASGPRSWERLVDHVQSIPEGIYEGHNDTDGWDNHTEWGRRFGEDGVPWCVIFDWCMYDDVGLADLVPKVDNVDVFSDWARARGQWSEYPSVGAWVNFSNGAHTELVLRFDDTYVWTKGGNTLPTGGDGGQGNGVYAHRNLRHDPKIVGYFAPNFPDGCPPTADPNDYRAGRATPPAEEAEVTPDELLHTKVPAAALPSGYVPEVWELLRSGSSYLEPALAALTAKVAEIDGKIAAPTPVQVDTAALVAALKDPTVISALAQALLAEAAARLKQ
ncbi:glycoside hydrolase family 25 protein [Embleya sp. AB8]|uniref:glycoside hydrolase family 25 protein n=1 Tax=Embleya sp. AB8 TaxID=3156304 RepID=UPI003C763675